MSQPDAPAPNMVNKFHSNSDADVSKVSQHHTLGTGANQASPGDHTHDGRNSKNLLAGENVGIAPATYNSTWGQQVVDALRALGAGI